MVNSKKAVSLSLNTVIIGLLLLIVLAVVIFVFFKGTNTFSDGASACDWCVSDKSECSIKNSEGKTGIPVFSNCETSDNQDGSYCCTPLG